MLLAALIVLAIPSTSASASVPAGVWLIDGKAAVQIFDCSGQLSGRILWLLTPRNSQGQLNRDRNNPDPALRQRPLWRLAPRGLQPLARRLVLKSGRRKTYRVSAKLRSAALIVAWIHVGVPLLGETKTLVRVAHGTSEGWC
ncbi:DUF2147 domain-containing protein [Teichococcus coralli]|uniref:DUF2147 domain-containing protein n=1 Tax=Teichococcus coralli TaxID=2545983 RepID=UPI0034629DF7